MSKEIDQFIQFNLIDYLFKNDRQKELIMVSRLNKTYHELAQKKINNIAENCYENSLVDSVEEDKLININEIMKRDSALLMTTLFRWICELGKTDLFIAFENKYKISDMIRTQGMISIGHNSHYNMIKEIYPTLSFRDKENLCCGIIESDSLECLKLMIENNFKTMFEEYFIYSSRVQSVKTFIYLQNFIKLENITLDYLIGDYNFDEEFNTALVDFFIKVHPGNSILNSLLSKSCRCHDSKNVERIIKAGATWCHSCQVFAKDHNNEY